MIYCLESGGNINENNSEFLYAVGVMHKNGADSTVILKYDVKNKTTEKLYIIPQQKTAEKRYNIRMHR